ncbi:Thioredoxin H9, partial [Mucuna pruriens]
MQFGNFVDMRMHFFFFLFPTHVKNLSHKKKDDDSDHTTFASGNVKLITTKESWDEKLEQASRESKIVIANFSATWCGPCKVIAPYYCELSEKYPSIMFLLVDVDELSEFSSNWDIKATPTFFFLKDGKEIEKLVGANKPELEKKIVAVTDVVPRNL